MQNRQLWASYLSLFSSLSTLLCCALPSLLVFLGMGAVMAGLVTTVPQIVWISEYKLFVFSSSGILVFLSALWLYLQRNAPCPIDPVQARACLGARKWSVRITVVALFLWGLGFFTAYVLPALILAS